ncbi:hypothetical protein PVAND_002709 [Polypedilum vanderplanki]|uniref:Uncharacterized protein n=1 Tax=Polypedilum vanderplanki TaxID=319348 RepID=A0A9J6BRT3_POLVA|nr:hypothetical protein PVAND_002709 [Polypedilum vanderplanki]
MSSGNESVESGLRVTRSKLRMNSTDSTLSSDQRPQTPTGRTRNTKKLEVIEEKLNTPTRRTTRAGSIQRENETPTTTPTKLRSTRAGSVQKVILEENQMPAALTPTKRLTRAGSVQRTDELKGSPARSTRRMSSDKNPIQESSIIMIDDDSISENALTPKTLKRNLRISTITKLEEVIEEESEVNNSNQSVDLNKSDSSNELELRNRSISKSPNVVQRASLNSSTGDIIEGAKIQENVQNTETSHNILNDENQTISTTVGMNKSLNSHVSLSENEVYSEEVIKTKNSSPINDTSTNQNENELEPEETEKSFKSVSLKVNSSFANHDISISTFSEQSNEETLGMSVFCSRKSVVNEQPMEIDDDLINLQTPPINREVKSPEKNLMSSIEKEKIKNLEQLILEEKNKCETTDETDSEKIVANMMEDFVVETPAKSPEKRKSLSKSSFVNEKVNLEIITEKSPKQDEILNKSKTKDDEDTSETEFSPSKNLHPRKSLNKSKIKDDNSEISTTASPKQRKSLNKNKIEDEDETNFQNKQSVSNQSSTDSSEISPTKSPKQRNSFNKSKIEDDKTSEISIAENPKLCKSLSKNDIEEEKSNSDAISAKYIRQRKSLNDLKREKEDFSSFKNNSWSQSVRNSASEHIDNLKITEKEVIKDTSKHRKVVSSDKSEDEDYEKDSFIDDEAEVASDEDSMTPSERNYLEENEIVDLGETLGSEDSESDEDYQEEEEGNSFIDNDENISDKYSMDSEEEFIEKDEIKRKSRIIYPLESSSEDESETIKKSLATTKSPEKNEIAKEPSELDIKDNNLEKGVQKEEINTTMLPKRKLIDQSIQIEDISMIEHKSSNNTMKENIENIINSLATPVSVDKKQKKLHMEDNSHLVSNEKTEKEHDQEAAIEQEIVSSTSKKQKRKIDYNSIYQRVNQHMEEFKANKKAQAELKKEKKAKKLAKKKNKEQEANGVVDSLSGDDKENSLKKKTKNKIKKQKNVEEVDDGKKEDLGSRLNKLQEKLELKRQRKREKKQAKMQENGIANESKDIEKPNKQEKIEEKVEDVILVPKKAKKNSHENQIDQQQSVFDTSLKTNSEKIKKKRKIEDVDESLSATIEKPRTDKKLKVLKQIDEPMHRVHQKTVHIDELKQVDSTLNLNKKLKNIIPNEVNTVKTKKQKLTKKVIVESKVSLPRPVFTTAGIFMEESITPYKFKSKEYKPIKSKMGRDPIALFQATKKKAVSSHADFRSEKLKKKNRDKSIKNLKNLM